MGQDQDDALVWLEGLEGISSSTSYTENGSKERGRMGCNWWMTVDESQEKELVPYDVGDV